MKKAAVLLDLAFVLRALYKPLGYRLASADEVHEFANRCLAQDEELFRIYCYHCPPFEGTATHPLTRTPVYFKKTATFAAHAALIKELSLKDGVAFRAGELSFTGWIIRKRATEEVVKKKRALKPEDFEPDLKQKRVDMKIGLDVAWLSSKRIVDRIVLVAGDSDFVPAMKFARREGVQVVLIDLGAWIKSDLRIHADQVRVISFQATPVIGNAPAPAAQP